MSMPKASRLNLTVGTAAIHRKDAEQRRAVGQGRSMDARSERNATPLVVDLDGTLIAGDLLWEGLFLFLRKHPLCLFLLPFWLLGGPAQPKNEIARRVSIDPAGLSYREPLLARLREEHAAGRKIVLATGTPRAFAEPIAAHLGVFDAVLATNEQREPDLAPQAQGAGRGLWRRRLRLCRQQPPRRDGVRRRAASDRRGSRPRRRALAARAWRRTGRGTEAHLAHHPQDAARAPVAEEFAAGRAGRAVARIYGFEPDRGAGDRLRGSARRPRRSISSTTSSTWRSTAATRPSATGRSPTARCRSPMERPGRSACWRPASTTALLLPTEFMFVLCAYLLMTAGHLGVGQAPLFCSTC